MKRQPYFPRTVGDRPGWFENFAIQLPTANGTLVLPAADVSAIVADAKYCQYASGAWLTGTREFGPASTAALDGLFSGSAAGPFALPGFLAPPLPAGVVPVPAGALDRIFNFVQTIKASKNYTEAMGLMLQIVGSGDTNPAAALPPSFTLKTERSGTGPESVRLAFTKAGHQGVVIFGRRGAGAWEMLAIDLASPYLDARALLVAGQPEVREYRLQFYDNDGPSGDFSDVSSVTVSP